MVEDRFTWEEVVEKHGESPVCHLTGRTIDWSKPSEYEFDHIYPRAKGGDNSLGNLGIAVKAANRAKSDMTVDEFLALCKEVLENHGYVVS